MLRARNMSQKDLAEASGIDEGQISKYANDREYPNPATVSALAIALRCHVMDLTTDVEMPRPRLADYARNPKPIRIADVCLENVFLMWGNHVESFELSVRYDPKPLGLHPKIRPLYQHLAEQAASNAKTRGADYFPDGPCARLKRIVPNTQEVARREQRGAILELGPLSWEEYAVLNEYFVADTNLQSVRDSVLKIELLYEHALDLSWCPLSNIMTVVMTPITKDGYGLIQRRGRQGVSCAFELLTAGVNENIHRYMDEAPITNFLRRLHTIDARNLNPKQRWHPSESEGVPNPVLTAQRGVFEEVSPEIHRISMQNPANYKFLNIIFDFHFFHPNLVGVVELDMTRKEVEKTIEEYPPISHSEYTALEYLALDKNNNDTMKQVSDKSAWCCWGLSAFISAMHYWESTR